MVVAALVAACLCGSAAAQTARKGPPESAANSQLRVQLAKVRSALKLTPEQAANWQLYESKVVNLLDDLGRGPAPPADATAIRQIDARVDVLRSRLTAMEDIADAAAKLYSGLSEEQKGTADRLLAATLPTPYPGLRGRAEPRRGSSGRTKLE
jgi:hypothetical protein